MSHIDKLLEEFERGSSQYLKLVSGKKKLVRMLPPYSKKDKLRAAKKGAILDKNSGILVFHNHEYLPKLDTDRDDIRTNYRCLKDLNQPCGFCDFFDSLGDNDKSLKSRHGRRAKAVADFWLPKTGEVKRWFFGKTVLERFQEIFDLYPDVNNEETGRDLLVLRTGQKLETKYRIKVLSNVRPLEIESDLPDIINQLKLIPVATPKQIKRILKEAFEGESDEDGD